MPQSGPPNRRVKSGSQAFTFNNVHDIKQALCTTQDPNVLSKALSALRSRLSLKPDEKISPHDERLTLAKLWMESSPIAKDLFDVWGAINDMSMQALVTSSFASLLALFSCHLPDHSCGISIIKMLLSPQWLRKLNSYVGGSHNEQILAALELFNTISMFGSGRERKSVFEAFPWDSKSLPKLLYMRRRGRGMEEDVLVRPDIRTCYVLFVLSMVDKDTAPAMKAAFLEQRREVFVSIFKGLAQDHYAVLKKVLQASWEDIWLDPKIKRTTKLTLFNEFTISHLLKLYDRAAAERPGGEHIPADVVHHFLLAICTHPGQGVCFKDRGWYPRDSDEDEVADKEDIAISRGKRAYTGKIYNKILANILRTLKVNEDARQQELALKIVAACPELVAGYWSAASLTLEPRLSSKWIANISFAGQVLSQAVPLHSFLLPGSSELYNPTPPPLSIIMANLLPSVGTKTLFTKGLQATSTPIVQHCTALMLAKCLRKLAEVVRVFKMVESALQEEEEEGQWSRHRRGAEKEARRRVPEFQVVVAFSQQSLASPNTTKHGLLSESAQRLLWLYQECLPEVVAEARFEVGKLVLNSTEGSLASLSDNHETGIPDQERNGKGASAALQSVKHLHVLRLLSGSDQFTWTGKVTSSSHTYFYVLLRTFCNSHVQALRITLKELLQRILSESVLFQENPNEVEVWLTALPLHFARRGQGTEAPDGTPLTDEVEATVTFLDDCALRCIKTPYRYMETMSTLVSSTISITDIQSRGLFASPLLMTVVEQVIAKVNGSLMTPSDTLAVFTFIRRLLVLLAAKQGDSGYRNLLAILNQLDSSVVTGQLFSDRPSISFGIKRELSIARACLCHLEVGDSHMVDEPSDKTITTFLDRIEQIPIPSSESGRVTSAFELVDWLRLVDAKPSAADMSRLALVIQRLSESALWAFVGYLHPYHGHMWDSGILKLLPERHQVDGAFDWTYFHCSIRELQDRQTRNTLLAILYARPVTLVHLEDAIRLVTHAMGVSVGLHDLTAALLSLVSDLLVRAKGYLSEKDLRRLKVAVIQSNIIQALCLSQDLTDEVHEAIREFITVTFDPGDAQDKVCLSSIGTHWMEMMKRSLSLDRVGELKHARPWIKFVSTEELISAVDIFRVIGQRNAVAYEMLEDVLDALQHSTRGGSSPKIPAPKLLELYAAFPRSTLLEDMLSTSLLSQLPLGLDGQFTFTEGHPLSEVLSRIKQTHLDDLRSLPSNLISQFLEKETWTDPMKGTIIALLYSNTASVQAFATWLNTRQWSRFGIPTFASVFAAFLDCSVLIGQGLSQVDDDALYELLKHLFPGTQCHASRSTRHLDCIRQVLELSGIRRDRLTTALQARIEALPLTDVALETTFLARKLFGMSGYEDLTTGIVDHALQWAVRHLPSESGDSDDSGSVVLENLKCIATQQRTLKPHLVEPLLVALVQRHLSDPSMLDLAVVLTNRTPLKPVVANRLLQNVLQHQQFVMIFGKHGNSSQRNQATHFLDALFRMHPTNSCQPSHLEPLFQVYGGTMSAADRRLLGIMRLFETEKRTSLSVFFSRWSPSPDAIVSNALEAVQSFDPVHVLRTCLAFPSWRRFGEETGPRDSPADGSMYDPLMMVALCAQMLAECPPTTALGWVKVFRTNIVSLLVRCLSSKDVSMRETALCQIASLTESLQRSNMYELPQVLYVFRLLKNVVYPPVNTDDPPHRLPTYTTLILLHALRGIFYPSNFIYKRTSRFLLQRPELDVSDVPMLFGMLYSSSTDDWKKERGWMLKMLGDGMASTEDWKVLRRRHTWDLVASLFQSSKSGITVRSSILEILANLTCNPQACTSLVLKSSLLSWIEMQVRDSPDKESIAWFRILENILVVADIFKLTRATGDQWCSTVCRCISSLVRRKDVDMAILRQASSVILRLSLTPDVPDHSLRSVIVCAARVLCQLEHGIYLHPLHPRPPSWPNEQYADEHTLALALPPHRAQGLHDLPSLVEPPSILWAWGKTVEMLWRASMALDDDGTHAWVSLTRRLVVWRALVGEEVSPIGEWARQEVVGLVLAHRNVL